MYLVEKKDKGLFTLPAKELSCENLKVMGSPLATRILETLSKGSSYPKEIAERLGVHEQKVYYHIKNFLKNGIVEVSGEESRQGATAKYYSLTRPSFFVRFKDPVRTGKLSEERKSEFLDPFIKNGSLNANIIIGSPHAHGPERSRSRDGFYGIDVALFLGTFLNYASKTNVRLDTELRSEDLRKNLILLGGPVVNKITERFNAKMPIRFDFKTKDIYSSITKKTYSADETGLIVRFPNPYKKDKHVLVLAGKRYSGTRAATIALVEHLETIEKGNALKPKIFAKVVEGIDADSDGTVDSLEFLE
ncbi:TPA: S-layer protein [archaeon]|jgi:DNA-binding transcriptional ArsR family regulator|uniref:S-layer protein n=1 Tax=Candidatus Undinarchaeum marinum TaxID=2756141 RepID=A0A832UU46_9ARCH|nr:S-layer protein [Candidatus Undinarchaeum marinum]